MMSTSDVLDRHLKSFAEHDVEGVLADGSGANSAEGPRFRA